jgi:lipopolysaccharide transport system ATP-binding protein
VSGAIIIVEGLGKKYRISRQTGQPRYNSLRDVIAEKAKALFENLKSGMRRPEIGNPKSDLRPSTSDLPLAPPAQDDFWALKDVSFEVKQGEVVGIIGRNGAGKSTLLKILSRITEPTEGRVHIKGRVASLLEVGTGFHPELTGRENIFLNGAILGMTRAEIKGKFDEIVEFAEVEKFLDTPVKRYSSGMYVRLAFAVAAHLEPEILIVDEVLAVGDAEFQKKCLGTMKEVSLKHGRTVLFVSHNLSYIRRLCSAGLLLKGGIIIKAGPISPVLAEYGEGLANAPLDIKDQHGRTNVTIHSIDLYVNGAKCDSMATGDTVTFRINVSFANTVQHSVRVGIALENMLGVLTMINYSHFHAIQFSPTSGTIAATIRDTPLAEGSYRLHLRMLANNQEIYWSTGAKDIRIEAGDYYGTGIRGEEHLCPWLHKVEWKQL